MFRIMLSFFRLLPSWRLTSIRLIRRALRTNPPKRPGTANRRRGSVSRLLGMSLGHLPCNSKFLTFLCLILKVFEPFCQPIPRHWPPWEKISCVTINNIFQCRVVIPVARTPIFYVDHLSVLKLELFLLFFLFVASIEAKRSGESKS